MLILLPKGVRNLTDIPFGKLTPKQIVEIGRGQGAIWLCECECGRQRRVSCQNLTSNRVTCCNTCRREQRTAYLLAGQRRELEAGRSIPAGASDYEKRWRYHLERMTPEQRAQVTRFVERRKQQNVAITNRLLASAVDVVMRELAA